MEELLAKLTTEEPSDTFAVTIKKLVDDAGQKDVYIVALEKRLETIERTSPLPRVVLVESNQLKQRV